MDTFLALVVALGVVGVICGAASLVLFMHNPPLWWRDWRWGRAVRKRERAAQRAHRRDRLYVRDLRSRYEEEK